MFKLLISIILTILLTILSTVAISFAEQSSDKYIDIQTGHTYTLNTGIISSGPTYNEYSRTGKFLKKISGDLPLLSNKNCIKIIGPDCFIQYYKRIDGEVEIRIQQGYREHPMNGWKTGELIP